MALVGNAEYTDSEVIPLRPLTLANGDHTALAGEVCKSGVFYGMLQDNASTGDLRSLTLGILRLKKIYGGGSDTIATGDPITFVVNPTATKNDYWVTQAGSSDEIHGYALENVLDDDTDVLVLIFRPPFAELP